MVSTAAVVYGKICIFFNLAIVNDGAVGVELPRCLPSGYAQQSDAD